MRWQSSGYVRINDQICFDLLLHLCYGFFRPPASVSSKIEHAGTWLVNTSQLALEHWPLWLARAWWPCCIPFRGHFSQCKQKTGALIRDVQMGRSWRQKASCPSALKRPACLERNAARGVFVSAELRKQQRPLCRTLRMHAQFSISCTSGGGFLISDCLYLQMGRCPFVCRWPALRWHLIPAPKTCSHARVHSLPAWEDY